MARLYYEQTMHNKYLGEYKVIRGSSPLEVQAKVEMQLSKWSILEKRLREKEFTSDLKLKAELDTEDCLKLIEEYNSILMSTLTKDDRINWSNLMNNDIFPKLEIDIFPPVPENYKYRGPEPQLHEFLVRFNVPENNLITRNVPIIKQNYQKKLNSATVAFNAAHNEFRNQQLIARRAYENAVEDYQLKLEKATVQYEYDKKMFEIDKANHNQAIEEFKALFESNDKSAVIQYIEMVLENSSYPDGFEQKFEINYDDASGIVLVNYFLPNNEQVPNVKGYKYVASRKTIDSIEMKAKEFSVFYEDIILQTALKTIHEVFESVYIPEVKSVVFNGWVTGINRSTGHDFTSCVISLQVSREVFESINLERITPKDCVRSFKGLTAAPLIEMAPVNPIMQMNKEDNRFVESKEILDGMDENINLVDLPWEDFEHLVRELFQKIFSKDGGEVNVTRASRDGGVDAIAFDPDPIRGGKFVIQAKRYNNVVGVSAVRDLYGTMLNEGAVKGILVTTSYYGNDSREFAKDKPITLIDGSNLVHLLNQEGYKATIELRKKKIQ